MVSYGAAVADDSELRLCGDVQGKRVLELGITAPSNAVTLAMQGARAMAVDPSSDRIALLRRQAEQAEVTVQCHNSELADLGFATSASVDLVVASQTLREVDDLARLLRQVHRVLKPGSAFIIAEPHPVASMFDNGSGAPSSTIVHPYGEGPARSMSDFFMTLQRTNFQIDSMHELMSLSNRSIPYPSVIVLRARKLGV